MCTVDLPIIQGQCRVVRKDQSCYCLFVHSCYYFDELLPAINISSWWKID